MSFGDHVILWLHVTAAVFTIGPGTAAIMSTPRYIRKRNPVVVGYLFRTTRIYSFAALLTLIFGLILAGMTHKFSQWWISASLTLFVVAFVLLVFILRDQRKALTALDAAEGAAVADAMEDSVHGEAAGGCHGVNPVTHHHLGGKTLDPGQDGESGCELLGETHPGRGHL